MTLEAGKENPPLALDLGSHPELAKYRQQISLKSSSLLKAVTHSKITAAQPSRFPFVVRSTGADGRKEIVCTQEDTLAGLRSAVAALVPQPVPVNHLFRLPQKFVENILTFIPSTLVDLVHIASTCRRLRLLCIPRVRRVVLTPHGLTAQRLEAPGVLASISVHLDRPLRGQYVEELVVVDEKVASRCGPDRSIARLTMSPVQSLLVQLPYLTTLDLRCVEWKSATHTPSHFLSDLYLVAPRLQTLKVGILFLGNGWEPQWWAKLPRLANVVFGSRAEVSVLSASQADRTPPVTLCDDFFAMLRSSAHGWKIKIWCAIHSLSLQALFNPHASGVNVPVEFPLLQELTVNVSQGGDVLLPTLGSDGNAAQPGPADGKDAQGASDSGSGAGKKKGVKRPTTKGNESPFPHLLFPTLSALTVVDLDVGSTFATELLTKIPSIAPSMSYFTMTNTNRKVAQ